jgi:hypothetical protein
MEDDDDSENHSDFSAALKRNDNRLCQRPRGRVRSMRSAQLVVAGQMFGGWMVSAKRRRGPFSDRQVTDITGVASMRDPMHPNSRGQPHFTPLKKLVASALGH